MTMMLSELLQRDVSPDLLIHGVSDDSRLVKAGELFCAVAGERSDGRDYASQAVQQGAAAVLSDIPAPNLSASDVPVFELPDLAQHLGEIASRFYGEPSQHLMVVAVTGTNGKTSFTHLFAQAISEINGVCGLIGTMGVGQPGQLERAGLTTPSAIALQRELSAFQQAGFETVVLEASSHGLVQGRLKGTAVDIAVLTNITRDHLDYHKTFDNYCKAKKLLFSFPTLSHAVINLDDGHASQFINVLRDDVSCIGFSANSHPDALVSLIDLEQTAQGMAVRVAVAGNYVQASVPLLGSFNVENLLAVIASLHALGLRPLDIEAGLSKITPVDGRMQVVATSGQPTVVIDYAHTPDALEKSLLAIKEHFPNSSVACVFGCGGDRDRGKRPLMGEVASRLADSLIVTSDNPRSEQPEAIIEDVSVGISRKFISEVDRRLAIQAAIAISGPSDVVLVAGKGHENYQELATGRVAFSDVDVVNKAIGVTNGRGA